MGKPTSFHKDVDYTFISEEEQKYKSSRELYTIFYLTKNQGLSDMGIYEWAKKLGFTGYDGFTPDAIVRSNIYRWNDMVITAITSGLRCAEDACNKKCIYGYEKNKPLRCAKHKLDNMHQVVEQRLVKHKREPGASKGKFYFDENFAKKVFPHLTHPSHPSKPSNPTSSIVLPAAGTISPAALFLNSNHSDQLNQPDQSKSDEVDYDMDEEYEDDSDTEDTLQHENNGNDNNMNSNLNSNQPIDPPQFQPHTESVLSGFANDFLSMNNSYHPRPQNPLQQQQHMSSISSMSSMPFMPPMAGSGSQWNMNMMYMMNPYMWSFPMHWMYSMMMMMNPGMNPSMMNQNQQRVIEGSMGSMGSMGHMGHMGGSYPQHDWQLPALGTSPSWESPIRNEVQQRTQSQIHQQSRQPQLPMKPQPSAIEKEVQMFVDMCSRDNETTTTTTTTSSQPVQPILATEPIQHIQQHPSSHISSMDYVDFQTDGDQMFNDVLANVTGETAFNGGCNMFQGNPLLEDISLNFNDIFQE